MGSRIFGVLFFTFIANRHSIFLLFTSIVRQLLLCRERNTFLGVGTPQD